MSDEEWKEEQFKVLDDIRLGFRHEQIDQEGNDPIKSGESFGTPHDLAALTQQEGGDDSAGAPPVGENKGGAPEGGFDGAGRPKKSGNYGTDENPFGRDPLGNKSIKVKSESYKANSVINKETIDALVGGMKRKVKTKKIILESLSDDDLNSSEGLLDEKNILNSNN